MELALQFGWGMMQHTRSLLKQWGPATVILSPRDLNDDQLRRFSQDVRKLQGRTLLDPQFYLPHSDHHRLIAHEYWPDDYDSVVFWSGAQLEGLLKRLEDLNKALGCEDFILPGLHASAVDDDWLTQQAAILDEAERVGIDPDTSYATVALGDTALVSDAQVEELLEGSRNWQPNGIYLICEHPQGDYLVDNPTWLANQLDLIAGWALRGKRVVLGYSNHQNLLAGAAGAAAIASGTWMNVRSFPPDKFRTQYEEEIRRRTTWYYAPSCLSEFKLPYLDMAARQGLLSELSPPDGFPRQFTSVLFSGAQPSATGFSERDAFRHYLYCLRVQSSQISAGTFSETVAGVRKRLDTAEDVLGRLHAVGIYGQNRDFGDSLDACRAALGVLEGTRGPLLTREWGSLPS